MEEKKIPLKYNWLVIILMFIVFWPIGVGLVIKRLQQERLISLLVGNLMAKIGWGMLSITIIGVIVEVIYGDVEGVVSILVHFGVISSVLLGLSTYIIEKSKRDLAYLILIQDQKVYDFLAIAEALKTSTQQVKEDVERLLHKGYLRQLTIAPCEECLVDKPIKEYVQQ